MLSTLMFDNGSARRARTKLIGARPCAAVCPTNAAVNCLAAGCDWSDEGWADEYRLQMLHRAV